jgi:hypothetical protein
VAGRLRAFDAFTAGALPLVGGAAHGLSLVVPTATAALTGVATGGLTPRDDRNAPSMSASSRA